MIVLDTNVVSEVMRVAPSTRVLDWLDRQELSTAAYTYSQIMALRKKMGRPLSAFDGQIAAIAIANNFAVATHNVSDFDGLTLHVIDPFQEPY